jgi:hypothetical protein
MVPSIRLTVFFRPYLRVGLQSSYCRYRKLRDVIWCNYVHWFGGENDIKIKYARSGCFNLLNSLSKMCAPTRNNARGYIQHIDFAVLNSRPLDEFQIDHTSKQEPSISR